MTVTLPATFIMSKLVIPKCGQVNITLNPDTEALIKMGIGPAQRIEGFGMAKSSVGPSISACGERSITMSYRVNAKTVELPSGVVTNNPIPLGNAQDIISIQMVPFSELNSMKEIEHRHRNLSIWLSVEYAQCFRILVPLVLKSTQEHTHP